MIRVHHINTINGANNTNNTHDIALHIESSVKIEDNKIYYSAANSPDFRTSFTGSSLPFYSEEQAFDNSKNAGYVVLDDSNISVIKMNYPNAYYTDLGNTYVKPHIKLWFYKGSEKHETIVKLSDGIQYRSLTHPYQRRDSEFYGTLWGLPVRSQEQILRDSSFPKTDIHHEQFWGLKPPK